MTMSKQSNNWVNPIWKDTSNTNRLLRVRTSITKVSSRVLARGEGDRTFSFPQSSQEGTCMGYQSFLGVFPVLKKSRGRELTWPIIRHLESSYCIDLARDTFRKDSFVTCPRKRRRFVKFKLICWFGCVETESKEGNKLRKIKFN